MCKRNLSFSTIYEVITVICNNNNIYYMYLMKQYNYLQYNLQDGQDYRDSDRGLEQQLYY